MPFNFPIPTLDGAQVISVEPGSSVIFVGANGTGKTRLAAYMEEWLGLTAHRISAHRALNLKPDVPKISEQEALLGLRTGFNRPGAQVGHRINVRWAGDQYVSLLNDFDFVVQALFAEQANKCLETHTRVRAGDHGPADPTKFEHLAEIWNRLLSHRQLHFSGDNIEVTAIGSTARYNASKMSDGERAIFYLVSQVLTASLDSVIIIDEPELHVHRSIMAKLWDELEAARQDCAFVFITHDLEFAASRMAQKFVIQNYDPTPLWSFTTVPEDTGFSEEVTTLILGSRRPILFVEGTHSSLDIAIYRSCFPDWTVIAKGSCEEVLHSVVTMRRNESLTRITCSGIVDADDYDDDDAATLREHGVEILPVSEIENLILLPSVTREIAISEGFDGPALDAQVKLLHDDVFESLRSNSAIDAVVMRYCRRRIDRLMKKIDLTEAANIDDLKSLFVAKTSSIDIQGIADRAKEKIQNAIEARDIQSLLKIYDNKGLMASAARHLKRARLADFEDWLVRVLRNGKTPSLTAAISEKLPTLTPR